MINKYKKDGYSNLAIINQDPDRKAQRDIHTPNYLVISKIKKKCLLIYLVLRVNFLFYVFNLTLLNLISRNLSDKQIRRWANN